MAMSSLTYILGFSVRFFQPVYSVYEYYEIKITSKSFAQKFELKWSLGKLIENGGVTHNFESGPPKDHFNSNFWAKDFDVIFIS
jgi:hypothetical protein